MKLRRFVITFGLIATAALMSDCTLLDPGEAIEVQPNLNFPDTLFEIPPLPTATPQPGCLWYDQQQQEACFPIDSCPVDFDDSLGACVP